MDEVLGVTAYAGIKADKVKVVITDDAGNTIPASLLNVEVTGSDGDILGKTVLKAGDLIKISRWKELVRFLRGGTKNFTYEFTLSHMKYADGTMMRGQAAYAEIECRVAS